MAAGRRGEWDNSKSSSDGLNGIFGRLVGGPLDLIDFDVLFAGGGLKLRLRLLTPLGFAPLDKMSSMHFAQLPEKFWPGK